MSKHRIILTLILITGLFLISSPQITQGWPDEEGAYYVVSTDSAPRIDGSITENEWSTDEEFFQDTISYSDPSFPGSISFSAVILVDTDNLYVLLTFETGISDDTTANSVGIALSDKDPASMLDTYDRKIAYFNGTDTNLFDFYNCQTVDLCTREVNGTNEVVVEFLTPGVPDSEINFDARFGFDSATSKAFYEFSIPLNPSNTTEDFKIDNLAAGKTFIEFVANPTTNIAESVTAGHGGAATAPLVLQYESRCQLICQPEGPMEGAAKVFNLLFALLIGGIFLSFILSGRSDGIAKKLWKVDITEEMASQSILMEMAYYNSSFLSLLTAFFFTMYGLIAFIYGLWANWGLVGILINGIPTLIGIYAIYDLIKRNSDPNETSEERLGTNVQDSTSFWIVPTLFLGITLFMLVFIGIGVIT